jgi:hypothetical protein
MTQIAADHPWPSDPATEALLPLFDHDKAEPPAMIQIFVDEPAKSQSWSHLAAQGKAERLRLKY